VSGSEAGKWSVETKGGGGGARGDSYYCEAMTHIMGRDSFYSAP